MQKLIMLNGFASSGKSTIGKRYIDDHPLALCFEGDVLITMMGQWLEHYEEAAQCKLALSESIVETHLAGGHDVVLPFLLTDSQHAERYESIAQKVGAKFYEILFSLERDKAIARLMKRGRWGEDESPPLTKADLPKIEKLYDTMIRATNKRPNTIIIPIERMNVEETYQEVLQIVKG